MTTVPALIIIIVCLLLSSFFAGSETALTASSRARMLWLEKQGDRRAAIVNRLLQSRERLLGALLLGNNAVNIAASSLATGLLLAWLGDVGVVYATVVMTALVVVFCEVLPKTAAINAPDRVAVLVAALDLLRDSAGSCPVTSCTKMTSHTAMNTATAIATTRSRIAATRRRLASSTWPAGLGRGAFKPGATTPVECMQPESPRATRAACEAAKKDV